MKYRAIGHDGNIHGPEISFRSALFQGQPPGGGLYFPLGVKPNGLSIGEQPAAEIAARVLAPFVAEDISFETLSGITRDAFDFEVPLRRLDQNLFVLELFHGPTQAFKDFGARFLARCIEYFAMEQAQRVTVLVATSGDTGGAVASAFAGNTGVDVVILYPRGRVSDYQERQLTGTAGNVRALAVEGDFDDCQALVKKAFTDPELRTLNLLSANSINIGRWLPQQVYYWLAVRQWPLEENPVFVVPSGNLGNVAAGLLAREAGLPVSRFIAACNANDLLYRLLRSGTRDIQTTRSTLSNAMDVSDPNNLARVRALSGSRHTGEQLLSATSIDDESTRQAMLQVFERYCYVADPHTAVGLASVPAHEPCIVLATAHPAKFPGIVREVTGVEPAVPANAVDTALRPSTRVNFPNDYARLKRYLLDRLR